MTDKDKQELKVLRAFDKWLREVAFGEEQYKVICDEFAKDYKEGTDES